MSQVDDFLHIHEQIVLKAATGETDAMELDVVRSRGVAMANGVPEKMCKEIENRVGRAIEKAVNKSNHEICRTAIVNMMGNRGRYSASNISAPQAFAFLKKVMVDFGISEREFDNIYDEEFKKARTGIY